MIASKFPSGVVLAAAGLLCLAGAVWGNPGDDGGEEPEGELVAVPIKREPSVIDQRLFPRQNPQAARALLDVRLESRIGEIDRICRLTPAQTQKLDLAGRTEIKRLFDRLDAARREYERCQTPADAKRVLDEQRPAQAYFTDQAFHEGTLFHKVALSTLSTDQRSNYQRQLDRHFQVRRTGIQQSFLSSLERIGPLEDDQRDRLEALLDELPLVSSGYYESQAFWYLAAQVPEEKYREVLNDDQWRLLQNRFAWIAKWGPMLRQAGALRADAVLPEERR